MLECYCGFVGFVVICCLVGFVVLELVGGFSWVWFVVFVWVLMFEFGCLYCFVVVLVGWVVLLVVCVVWLGFWCLGCCCGLV